MRKGARWIAAVPFAVALTACGNGHGLLGPDNVGQMNSDDGVQYAQLWKPCGTPGDRSEVELLADGKTWVVDKNADVSTDADSKHQVKVKVDSKGRLQVLAFTHGSKPGHDGSRTPEDEHRKALMKVQLNPMSFESAADTKPRSCNKPSPSPSPSARRHTNSSTTPLPVPPASSSASPTKIFTPKPSPTKSPKKITTGSSGSGTKTCKTVNGKRVCS